MADGQALSPVRFITVKFMRDITYWFAIVMFLFRFGMVIFMCFVLPTLPTFDKDSLEHSKKTYAEIIGDQEFENGINQDRFKAEDDENGMKYQGIDDIQIMMV